MERTVCLVTPSCVGRRWLVETEEVVPADDEGSESVIKDVVKELASDKAAVVLERIHAAGFKIINHEWCVLTSDRAAKYLAASGSAPTGEEMVYLTSGPIIALYLEKENAVAELQQLTGPVNVEEARDADRATHGADVTKWSLHGAFGIDNIRVGVRASVNAKCAAREAAVLFKEQNSSWERAIALLNPASVDQIDFKLLGLCVVRRQAWDSPSEAQRASFPDAAYPVEAVVLEGLSAVSALQRADLESLGVSYASGSSESVPADQATWVSEDLPIQRIVLCAFDKTTELALELQALEYGFTIVARRRLNQADIASLGLEDSQAGAAFVLAKAGAAATCELMLAQNVSLNVYVHPGPVNALFPQLNVSSGVTGAESKAYLKSAQSGGSAGSEPQLVQSLLCTALAELCRTKPSGLSAVEALGEWLLLNNPDRRAAQAAERFVNERRVRKQAKLAGEQPSAAVRDLAASDAAIQASDSTGQALGAQKIVFVLGAPCTGKSTQCDLLVSELGYAMLSPAELLREEVEDKRSTLGPHIVEQMKTTGMVDAETTVAVLLKGLKRCGSLKVAVDGFPRDLAQVQAFEAAMASAGQSSQPELVLSLELSSSLATELLVERAQRRGRDDDADALAKRLASYEERAAPVLSHYLSTGRLRRVVQSDAKETAAQVFFERVMKRVVPEAVLLLGADAESLTSVGRHAAAKGNCQLLDARELVQREAATGSPMGRRFREMLSRGERIPTDAMVALFRQAMDRASVQSFALIGFPSTLEECAAFESSLFPLDRAVCVRSGRSTVRAAQWSPALADHLRLLGRLVDVHTSDLSADKIAQHCFMGSSLRYAVVQDASLAAAQGSEEVVTVDLAEVASFRAPTSDRFAVVGIPESVEAAHAVEVKFGVPPALCGADGEQTSEGCAAVVDEYALEGKLRPLNGCLRGLLPDLVVVLGSAGASAASLEQLAGEQTLTLVDMSAALQGLVSCAGTWEARAAKAIREASRRVLSQGEKEALEEDMRVASRMLVARALRSSVGRGVLLVGCDGVDSRVLEELVRRAARVVVVERDVAAVAAGRVPADSEDPEADLEAAKAKVAAEQAAISALVQATGVSAHRVNCDVTSENLQQLRGPFAMEIISLVAPRTEETKALCTALAKRFGLVRVRTLELFRTEAQRGTRHGRAIAAAMQADQGVPLETSVAVLQAALAKVRGTGATSVLLDGFPSVSAEAFPYAHDMLFALDKSCGPVKACIHVASDVTTASASKVVELFGSLDRLLSLQMGQGTAALVDATVAHIEQLHAKEAEQRRKDTWQKGDGSQEALLQQVLDTYEPSRAEAKAAEEYWAQFKLEAEYAVALEVVTAKLKEWEVELGEQGLPFEGPLITKAQWFNYVFQTLLNMEEAVVRHQRAAEAAAKKAAEEAAAAEQDE